MRVGDRVRLITPDNSKLDGQPAIIVQLHEWGAQCSTLAAATGMFRATWAEMVLATVKYTGDFCINCGSSRMRQAGACKVCDDCGESVGCG